MKQQEILGAYRTYRTIKATARNIGISEGTVRKALITAGLYTTPMIERIRELRAAGMPQKDIAGLLGISDACVAANSPYERPCRLDENKSVNALRIRASRARKKGRETLDGG